MDAMSPSAHQRLIRAHRAALDPRAPAPSLQGYTVELIERAEAEPLILSYEWLGTVGRATIFAGLFSPTHGLEGVACFGHGPSGAIRDLIGAPALCLVRGACVHHAPANAASFLISRACRLIHQVHEVSRFFAYADPMAGEYGGIYQATNWVYLGQGLNGGKGRGRRVFVLAPGRDPKNPANWQACRALRHHTPRLMSQAHARAQGWTIAMRETKHVYAYHVGQGRQRWRDALLRQQCQVHGFELPYPAPRPTLKRAVLERASVGRGRQLAADPEVTASAKPGEIGRGRTPNRVAIGHSNRLSSNAPERIVRRLKRDHPEIADALARGAYRSARAAGIAAGFIKAKPP